MEHLTQITSELTELLTNVVEFKDKEELIFKHIVTAEKLGFPIEDFPSSLDWFNTSEPLTRNHLSGKIVILDFFTYCCINCLHIIPQLRQLEQNYSVVDGLVVIGVHSAKFDNEKNSQNILLALKRYNISHPVVNDKNCYLWNKLGISCWPTLVILGPQTQPLFVLVGESHKDELLLFVEVSLKFYKNAVTSQSLPVAPCDQIITSNLLNFPGKISRWKNLFAISDSGNNRIIFFDESGVIKFKVGGESAGFKDGSFQEARFNSPQGLAFYTLDKVYVADMANHAIRLINLENLKVTTVVGNGNQGVDYKGGRIGTLQEISSPWDVCVVPCSDVEVPECRATGGSLKEVSVAPPNSFLHNNPPPPPPLDFTFSHPFLPPSFSSGDFPPSIASSPLRNSGKHDSSSEVLLIAAAGTHQIWAYFIESGIWWKGKKYEKNVCVAVAGSGKEENRNNRYPMMASFAQPSGLTYSSNLKSVFVADSESSTVRRLSLKDGNVSHVVGGTRSPSDLFSYGDVDGIAYEAKLQHPMGVIWSYKTNSLFVCDTYNHKIKKVDVVTSRCESLQKSGHLLNEPSGGCLNESEEILYICDTNNNCVKTINLSNGKVNKLEFQENLQNAVDTLYNIWEAETDFSTMGGTLTLKIEFTPKEIHGKWSLQLDESKIKANSLKGKLISNVAEFVFDVSPSAVDDVLQIFFDLILCGSEICSFKKLTLKLRIRKREALNAAVFCELSKALI